MDNLLEMPTAARSAAVVVMEPRQFADISQAVQALREHKTVLLNLMMMEPEQAQRAIDFIAGANYSIRGEHKQISESVFLFTPSCVQLSTQVVSSATAAIRA